MWGIRCDEFTSEMLGCNQPRMVGNHSYSYSAVAFYFFQWPCFTAVQPVVVCHASCSSGGKCAWLYELVFVLLVLSFFCSFLLFFSSSFPFFSLLIFYSILFFSFLPFFFFSFFFSPSSSRKQPNLNFQPLCVYIQPVMWSETVGYYCDASASGDFRHHDGRIWATYLLITFNESLEKATRIS